MEFSKFRRSKKVVKKVLAFDFVLITRDVSGGSVPSVEVGGNKVESSKDHGKSGIRRSHVGVDLFGGGLPVLAMFGIIVADVEVEVAFSTGEAKASYSSIFDFLPVRGRVEFGEKRIVDNNAKTSSLFGLV